MPSQTSVFPSLKASVRCTTQTYPRWEVQNLVPIPKQIRVLLHSLPLRHRWDPDFVTRPLHLDFIVDETESGQVFSRIFPFSPATNFIPPFLHTQFISHASVVVCQVWSAGILAMHRPLTKRLHRISSLDRAMSRTRVQNI